MKILFSKSGISGPISGADEIAVTYAVELKKAGHSTSVLLVHPPTADDPLATRLRGAGVPLTSLASPAFSASLAFGRELAVRGMYAFSPAGRLIRSYSRRIVFRLLQRFHEACRTYLMRARPDVVHIMTPDPGAVMLIRAAHSAGIPVVYQEVGIPFHPPGFEEVYERFVSVLPLCAEIATLSPRLADEMHRVLPQFGLPRVLPLISHGPNGAPPSPNPASDVVRFGFAARLEHLKGVLPLVEGFRAAHRECPSVELLVAGEGSLRGQVVDRLRRHGLEERARLLGVYTTRAEMSRFMQDIDVFVLPSLTEGTPNAVIEAMAHGRPIVTTDVGGIPDLVTEEEGILVPPDDAEALGAAMSRIAADAGLRRRMGTAARARYERLFTPGAVLPLLSRFYEGLANGRGGGARGAFGDTDGEAAHPWELI